jgi:phytoene dehydrogenase-like protein
MPHFMREVRNIRYQGTTARVNLALSDLPSFVGVSDANQLSGYIVYAPSLEYLERAADAVKYGRISERPVLEAIIPSLLDPSLAPERQHAMSITVQYAPYELEQGDWQEERERLGDQVVSLLSEIAPDLPQLILNRQVITPADYEHNFGLTEGHIFHGQMHLDQLFFMRPITGWANYGTPFENFFLCGSGTHPGGGLTGMPGYLASREILKA